MCQQECGPADVQKYYFAEDYYSEIERYERFLMQWTHPKDLEREQKNAGKMGKGYESSGGKGWSANKMGGGGNGYAAEKGGGGKGYASWGKAGYGGNGQRVGPYY